MDRILANAKLFHGLASGAIDELTQLLIPIEFPCRHVFFADGDLSDCLYFIISGKVKVGCRARDGRSNLSAILGPSDMFGELSVFDPGPRSSTATAVTAVYATPMDRDVLRAWIVERPEIGDRLLRMLARRLRRMDDDLADVILTDVTARVAKHLLRLAQRFGAQENGATRVAHGLTQEELAQLVGSSRESVCKALGDFSERGWIRVDGRSVLIIESERLAHRAG